MEFTTVAALIFGGLTVALAAVVLLSKKREAALRARSEAAERTAEQLRARFRDALTAEGLAATARAETESLTAQLGEVRTKYDRGLARLRELEAATSALEESLELIEVGLYKPHFTYADSEGYKQALVGVREQQKNMIKAGGATNRGTTWTVGGSAKEGARMVKQTEKLILRAFNAEADACVSRVSWNNYDVMERRIHAAFAALNKHGTVLQVSLTNKYLNLRLKELRLTFEHEHKAREEKEEQRRIRAEQREEEKAQREFERVRDEAEEDEARFAKALAKAEREFATARASEREAMQARIKALEADLAAAHDRKERAIAQAQLTRVGHVYVISNLGAFGEGVVKIGLTRRLDPNERVRELGDASVPFPFDIHALIYSENAPELETKLHERFWDRRVNWSNDRKEFFRVSVAEVRAALEEMDLKAEVLQIPEAREFRETLAAVQTRSVPISSPAGAEPGRFPTDPFESRRKP